MGAGFCSLYHEINYIEVRNIEVCVYSLLTFGRKLVTDVDLNFKVVQKK